ncbi:MAG: PilZ domain-containing protein [Desulfobacterales bacterium]|jgi:hypothetical protein
MIREQQNSDPGADRRQAYRMPYDTALTYRSGVTAGMGRVINISSEGLYFETSKPPTQGERLCIDFRFRNSQSAMQICGEIARTTPIGAGVRFTW